MCCSSFLNSTQSCVSGEGVKSEGVKGEGVEGEAVDVCELLRRVQEHVLVNRIRVSEHFQDFDPLRSGVISNQRFRQVGVAVTV